LQNIKLAFVVAVAENRVIGHNGHLPWRLSTDLKRFRQITFGKPVIMGRKTFQSIKKPLDGRTNIVVTHQTGFEACGAMVVTTLNVAIEEATAIAQRDGVNEIMVIGGAQIYAALLEKVDRIYLTRVHGRPQGDAHFPHLSENIWLETARENLPRGKCDDYEATLHVLDRQANAGTF